MTTDLDTQLLAMLSDGNAYSTSELAARLDTPGTTPGVVCLRLLGMVAAGTVRERRDYPGDRDGWALRYYVPRDEDR